VIIIYDDTKTFRLTFYCDMVYNIKYSKHTWRFARFLLEAGHDVSLKLTQRRRLQRLKVYLDLIRVGVLERRLTRLDNVDHTTQFVSYT